MGGGKREVEAIAEVVWVRAFMALFSFSFTCSYSIFVHNEQNLQNRNNAT